MRTQFSKMGDMAFISHLDLMRMFQRAARRSGLAVAITKGFSPHLKISISKALKLGVESESLEAVFRMEREMDPKDFIREINEKLPEGIRVTKAERQEKDA